MAEFDDKLSQILSNPEAMAQIARLAQSLNGPPPSAPGSPNGAGPPSGSQPNGNAPPPVGEAPPGPGSPSAGNGPPPAPDSFPGPPPDANSIAQFLPLLQELGGDSDARRLLYALRPYLRPHKQEKVEQALRLARLFRVGKKFLSQGEG